MSFLKTIPVFGGDFQQVVAGSNTNATAVMKLGTTITTAVTISGGTYRVGWYMNYSMSIITADFQGQITVAGSTVMSTNVELSDATTIQTASGFYYFFGDGTSKIIDLNFAAESGTATLITCALEYWRVT